jgi:hypothetical protein
MLRCKKYFTIYTAKQYLLHKMGIISTLKWRLVVCDNFCIKLSGWSTGYQVVTEDENLGIKLFLEDILFAKKYEMKF